MLGLLGRVKRADRLRRTVEGGIVRRPRVTRAADRRSARSASAGWSSATISAPISACVCATASHNGRAGASSAARSCRSSSLPTCGPLPCVITSARSSSNGCKAGDRAAQVCELLGRSAALAGTHERVPAESDDRAHTSAVSSSPFSARTSFNVGSPDLLEPVRHAQGRLVEVDQLAQVDRRSDQHEVCVGTLDRLAEVFHLLASVAHRRQERADRSDSPRRSSAIEPTAKGRGSTSAARAELLGGEDSCAVRHLAVRQRRTVLDGEHALARDLGCVALDLERRVGEHDLARRRCSRGSTRAPRRFLPASRCPSC